MSQNSSIRPFFRLTAFFLLVSITTAFFAGCFRKEQSDTQQVQPVELVYYKLFDEEDVMQPLIQAYTAQNPNVRIIYRKFEDAAEYERIILNELAEGEGPDIFSMPNYWILPNLKKITPMPLEQMTPAEFEQTFVNVATQDAVLVDPADGQQKVFGLPLTVDTLALYYNKAIYEDKIPSRGRPAPTWEGLKEDVYALTKPNKSVEGFEVAGIAMGRADNIARAIDILLLLMLQYKSEFYNETLTEAQFSRQRYTTEAGGTITPALEALKLYTSFALPTNKNYSWNIYIADPKSAEKELKAFVEGKVAMIFGYSYLYAEIDRQIKELQSLGRKTMKIDDVRIAAVPQVFDPATSTEKRDAYAQYFIETVARTTQHPREAWAFLEYLSSAESLRTYQQKTKRPTSRRDLIQEQQQDPLYGVYAEQIGYAESVPVYDYARYRDIFTKAIEGVISTYVSVNDALRIAEEEINDLLPQQGFGQAPVQQISTQQ